MEQAGGTGGNGAGRAPGGVPRTARVKKSAGEAGRFDVVIMADMSAAGGLGTRIASEIKALRDGGRRVGLIHSGGDGRRLSPEVGRVLGAATAIGQGDAVGAGVVFVYVGDGNLDDISLILRNVSAGRVVAGWTPECDVGAVTRALAAAGGPVTWAPCNPWVRAAIALIVYDGNDLPAGLLRCLRAFPG